MVVICSIFLENFQLYMLYLIANFYILYFIGVETNLFFGLYLASLFHCAWWIATLFLEKSSAKSKMILPHIPNVDRIIE